MQLTLKRTGGFTGNISDYGNEVTYKLENSKVVYSWNGKSEISNQTSFFYPKNGTDVTLAEGDSSDVFKNNLYSYSLANSIGLDWVDSSAMDIANTKVCKMLFEYQSILADNYISTKEGYATFGIRIISRKEWCL